MHVSQTSKVRIDEKNRLDEDDSFHTYIDPATRTSIDRALPKHDIMLINSIDANATTIRHAIIVLTAVQTLTGTRRKTTARNVMRPRLVLFMTMLVVICTFGSLEISLNGDPCQSVQYRRILLQNQYATRPTEVSKN